MTSKYDIHQPVLNVKGEEVTDISNNIFIIDQVHVIVTKWILFALRDLFIKLDIKKYQYIFS